MKPLKKSQKGEWPKLAVFDIEAANWTEVLIVCHIDEYGNEVSFPNIEEYLDWLLAKFEGDVVWSHFGSGYDNRFLVEAAQQWSGTSYKAIMSGGLPIIFILQNEQYKRPSKKNGKDRERQLKLLDSFRLLPTSLASVGKSLGMPKMDVDRARLHKLSFAEVREYCMSDCQILLRGLQRFRDTIVEQGGYYAPTSASIASSFIRADPRINWKRFFEPDSNYQRYSGESYEMGYPGSEPGLIQADSFSEGAYYGGRCEVFRRGEHRRHLYYYDIASAYPWAMRQKLPLYFQGFEPGAKWEDREELESILSHIGVSDAFVSIPKGTFAIPPLPVRTASGKVVFAEGKFHGRWTNVELWALYKRGKDKGIRIDVTAWAKYTGVAFARPFVDKFYALRKEAKQSGDEGQSMIYKILLNACYGKLAQQLEQSSYIYGPAWEFIRRAAEADGTLRPSPMPGVDQIVELSAGPFRHVAAGAYVTALARLKLLEGMETAMRNGAGIYYCDTDSIVVDKPVRHWGRSKNLGAWELENEFTSGEFLCPKVYRAVDMKGEYTLKAKGTNLKSQLEDVEYSNRRKRVCSAVDCNAPVMKVVIRQERYRHYLCADCAKGMHRQERFLRWCVYAREISAFARREVERLTAEETEYYGRVEAGLLGWRSSVAKGHVECTVTVLDRSARNEDGKRVHQAAGHSAPLYLEGEGDNSHLDVRTLDAESLIEMELGEHADYIQESIQRQESEVYHDPG